MSDGTSFVLKDVAALDAGGGFAERLDVAVRRGVITEVARNAHGEGPSIDCAGLWLLPGLFDCHAHLGCFTTDILSMLEMPVTRWTLELARNARLLLELGITFVRDVATSDGGIRDGIATGAVPGPTLQVSGPLISPTGGHGDGFLPGLGQEAVTSGLVPPYPGRPPYIADGVEQMRHVVRLHLRARVDWIKIGTTGGLLSTAPDRPDVAEFTQEEIDVAVTEASRAGVPVAAHAYGGMGITAAIKAGVRSIEHGIDLTEEQAAAMAKRGCWLVPTLAVYEQLGELAESGGIDQNSAAKVREVLPRTGNAVQIARDQGVRIAMGTDLVSQGRNLRELGLMHRAGLSVEETLLAATAGGAELCGVGQTRGRIAPGFVFDAILLDDDPGDLTVFDDPAGVTGVLQAGRVVRPHPRLSAVLSARVGS